MLVFSTSLAFIISGALIQNSHFNLWGIKPNIVLTVLVVLGLFEKDWLKRSVAVLLGVGLLAIEPSLGVETLFILAVFFFALALVDFLPWQPLPNGLAALILGTLAINLSGFQVVVFAIELMYDLGLFFLLFAIFGSWSTRRI